MQDFLLVVEQEIKIGKKVQPTFSLASYSGSILWGCQNSLSLVGLFSIVARFSSIDHIAVQ